MIEELHKTIHKEQKTKISRTLTLSKDHHETPIQCKQVDHDKINKMYEKTLTMKLHNKMNFGMFVNGTSHYEDFDYDYNEGDIVNVTCTVHDYADITLDVEMIEELHKTTYRERDSKISRSLTLSNRHHETTIQCKQVDHDNVNPMFQKTLTMTLHNNNNKMNAERPKTDNNSHMQKTTDVDDDTHAGNVPIWLWSLICCGCIILILISIAIVKVTKNQCQTMQQSNMEYENLAAQQNQPFPNSSRIEDIYCKPADVKSSSENVYAQPYRPNDVADLYSVPIPKNRRKNPPTECLYAELNLHNNEIASKRPQVKESDYACIVPPSTINADKMRSKNNDYSNVFDNDQYVNNKDTEYVEPSYCEVVRKNN
ncbi:uncharacterized protein LOC131850976 [Achroia grisella]|uniref:uncharacterized protein LOC131850976 n=1 Tax=Achroia grisella TaxID=688607 RepID=UPI0027D2CA59|nr:uncharacterized protein LOC131850976 [Achroia grisella]